MEVAALLASLKEANRALMGAWELVAYNRLDLALEAQLEGQINLLSERIRALEEIQTLLSGGRVSYPDECGYECRVPALVEKPTLGFGLKEAEDWGWVGEPLTRSAKKALAEVG